MGLRDTIDRLDAEARHAPDERTPTPEIVAGWLQAVQQLYRQIEAYLIDDLLRGQVRLQPRLERAFVPGLGPADALVLDIVVGRRTVSLVPRLELRAGRIGTVTLGDAADDGVAAVFPFTDAGEGYGWCVRAPERGVRRWLTGVLPERLLPLDEGLFKAALDAVLVGPQPVLTYDPVVARERLGSFLDHLTAAEIDVRLARLTRDSLLPELRKRRATVASSLKGAATGVLARVQGPRELLLEHHPLPSPAGPEPTDAAVPAEDPQASPGRA